MIESLELKKICDKYGINYEKLVDINSNILEYGEYQDICYVLDYLRDELKIKPKNIEKCPSILYRRLENIRSNYEFLQKEQITNYSVEGCLHILSTEPSKLIETYHYIVENYGIRYLNAKTSILRVPVERIKAIESKFPDLKKKNILQAACSRFEIDEIEKIISVCKSNRIEITGSVFFQSADEIKKIIEVCKANGIEITGGVFTKPAEEIEKIVKVCNANGIKITGSIFSKSADEIEKIAKVCNANGIEATGNVFRHTADEIEKIVKVCNTNGIEITGSVFKQPAGEMEKIVEVCKANGVEITSSVFSKSADEIEEIVKICKTNGIKVTDGVFRQQADEIKKIVEVCKENGVEITSSVFSKSADEIKKIIEVCKANGIEATGNIFRYSTDEIEKIIEVCKKNGIEITGSVFLKPADEIEKIVEVCKANGVEITGSVFSKSAKQLQTNINYIRDNYGDEYLRPLIISKNLIHLQKVLPYLKKIGVLEVLLQSASILSLTLDEMQERKNFIESVGGSMLNQKGSKFNPIFGLSRKNYTKRVKKVHDAQEERQDLDSREK